MLVLSEDMAEFTTGPIYLVDRQPGEAARTSTGISV
jgi:hypothetical protein